MAEPKWTKFRREEVGKELDFQIRVHIIEARELQPRDANGMSDPVCFVKALEKKKHTITINDTTTCTWDHMMFFDYKLLPDEFFAGKISVTVFDANTVTRNVEIGSFEFDAGAIYELEGHELYRKWVALTDRSGKKGGIQGYLKLSITVLGPRDASPAHDEKEEEDEESDGTDLQSMVLLPPSIKTEMQSLDVSVYRAENLPKMDAFGKCDGYAGVTFGGNKELVTEIIKKSYEPAWMETLSIPVQTPTMADLIKFQVKDWDQGTKDEVVATTQLKFSEVGAGTWKHPRWVNLYGTPDNVSASTPGKAGELAVKMNDGFIEGSCYRGRVLISMDGRVINDPKLGKTKTNPGQEPAVANYIVRFDLLEGSELQANGDVTVEISVGPYKAESKKAKAEVAMQFGINRSTN